jgi:hypothetical protein
VNSRWLLLPILALVAVSALLVTLEDVGDRKDHRPSGPPLSRKAGSRDEPSDRPRAATPTTQNSDDAPGSLIQPVDEQVHAQLEDWAISHFIESETRDWQRFELVHIDVVALSVLISAAPVPQYFADGSGAPPPSMDREADFRIKLFEFPEIKALVTSVSRYEDITQVAGLIEPVSADRDWRFTISFNPTSGSIRGSFWSPHGRFLITTTPDPYVAVVLWNPPPPPGYEDPPID